MRLDGLDEAFLTRGWTKTWQGKTLPDTTFTHDQVAQTIAKLLVAGLMGLLLLWSLIVTRHPLLSPPLMLGTFFLLSPTVFPWYVAWLVPWAGVLWGQRRGGSATLLAFCLLVPLAYLGWASARVGGRWEVPLWALWLEFGGVFGVWAWTHRNAFFQDESQG